MKRATLAVLLLLAAPAARAEDSVAVWGNYYKERSTRVISPMVTLRKELPHAAQADVTYLVDQITSASGAFTATDEPFSEYRQEVRVAARKRFFDVLTPGVFVRYSHEGDYRSLGYGVEVALDLFERMSTLTFRLMHQDDLVLQRGRAGFRDTLDTTMASLGWTQVLAKNLVGGLGAEVQILDGYTENPYRVEQHPRDRTRYALGGWLAYRHEETGTTARVDYRFYTDTWELSAHSMGLELVQRIVPGLEIAPRFRFHTQDGVYFLDLVNGFVTTDPKLEAYNTILVGARVSWRLDMLAGTALAPFQRLEIQPAYYYYIQGNRYGDAHIAQLGAYWPF